MTVSLPGDPATHPKLALRGVTKSFKTAAGPVTALEGVSLEIREGEFVACLVGPSGSGKSTLLNLLAGLEFPDEGEVLLDGKPVTGPGGDRMMMFQDSALFPWLNVLDNVLFGLKLKPGLGRRERRERAGHFLEMVGLERFARAHVHELSGGMKQRVAMARALAPNPSVLLMDEPFAALDAMTRDQLYDDLQEIWRKERKTIVFVTHNIREAACLGDRILLFSASPGRVQRDLVIPLPKPRDINSVEVAQVARELTAVLKGRPPGSAPGGTS